MRVSIPGMAVRSLRRRPLRVLLAGSTAAVAVGVVVATRALIAGLDAGLEQDLGRMGLRTVQVSTMPAVLRGGVPPARPMEPGDADRARAALREAGIAARVVEARIGPAAVHRTAGGPVNPFPVVTTGPEYLLTADLRLVAGRFLEDGDAVAGAPAVCVLDAATARALRVDRIPDTVSLADGGGNRLAEVVGILEDPFSLRPETSDPDIGAAARPSAAAFLAFRNVYEPRNPRRPATGAPVLLAVAERRRDAAAVHGTLVDALDAEERGLLVWSRGTWVRTMLETTGPQLQLVNILWGVVLVVAMVMLATVGMMAVRERTREMALRRAEGATRGAVVAQLLWEGGIVSVVGAVAGIPVGLGAAAVLSRLLTWRPVHGPGEALLAVGLGAAVGVGAALWPAVRAAGLPVVAGLRSRG